MRETPKVVQPILTEEIAEKGADVSNDAEIDYSDIPPLDSSFFTKATYAWPPAKKLNVEPDADRKRDEPKGL